METKKCTTCKVVQPLTEFRKDSSRSSGIHPTCNNCNKEIQKRWYQNNKEKAQTQSRARYQKNKDTIHFKRKQDRLLNGDKIRAAARKKYDPLKSRLSGWKQAGIKDMTHERYQELLVAQGNCCAICKRDQKEFKRKLAVDHDHHTGEVRGLLCDSCNGGIGKLKDSIELLERAILYLKTVNYE
jgi:hypothetical protein